ncbi:MAG: ChaN family lipoprotein [Hyphomicrobium sp.]
MTPSWARIQVLLTVLIVFMAVSPSVAVQALAGGPGCAGEIVKIGGLFGSKPVTTDDLAAEIMSAGWAVFGERHGVKEHPAAVACVMRALTGPSGDAGAPSRPAPVLVLEMLAADQQATIDDYRRRHPEIADGIGTVLKWWESGWPAWSTYLPLFETAWLLRAPVIAGDIARKSKNFEKSRIEAVLGERTPAVLRSWSAAMSAAHCDQIDAGRADELALRQAGRDIAMATAAAHGPDHSAGVRIVYAGRAHATRERAIPLVLGTMQRAKGVAIGLQETSAGGKAVDRAAAITAAKGRYDYLWFVGTSEQGDPCDALRAKGLVAARAGSASATRAGSASARRQP